MSSARTTRRQFLVGALGCGATLVAGCTTTEPPAPPPPDPLEPLLVAALADAALADAVAARYAEVATAARALAGDRRSHAETLRAEIRRATPSPSSSPSVSVSSSPSAMVSGGPAVPPDPAAAAAALVETTRAAARQAGELVTTVPRHRAGLVASVSACCASHLAVLA